MSRRAQKRQSLVVSLGDQNKLELEEIKKQKEQLMKEFEEQKAGKLMDNSPRFTILMYIELNTRLMEKQHELAKMNQELASLQPYRVSIMNKYTYSVY